MSEQFIIPDYHYEVQKLSVTLELFRYVEMYQGVVYLSKEIDKITRLHHLPRIHLKRVWVYVSQMFMTILTERTYTTERKIHLEDGLFNRCVGDGIKDFYRDLNYVTGSNQFKFDMFDLHTWIEDVIMRLKSLHMIINDNIEPFTVIEDNDTFTFKINVELVKQSLRGKVSKYIQRHLFENDKIFTLNREMYDRVQRRYVKNEYGFHNLLLCCLIRYESLGSGANQYMVDLRYKEALEKFGMQFECFASVFNCYYPYYCSMFYDLERHFGSCGSFMALNLKQGLYMANPPYTEYLLYRMYDKIKLALSSSTPIACIMSIPKWKAFPLETEITNDHLYSTHIIKHEKFHLPMEQQTLVPIPEYISYLFFNETFRTQNTPDYLHDLQTLFRSFKNI